MNDQGAAQLEPSVIVVFGITGDLAGRYLLPALYHLFQAGLLNPQTEILGLTRQDLTVEDVFGRIKNGITEKDGSCDQAVLKRMQEHSRLLQFDPSQAADYGKLRDELERLETEQGRCLHRLYYLSIPPDLFETTVQNLGSAGLNGSCSHGAASSRLLVEKPFGSDLASAQALIDATNRVFREEQVFRIDHYLAKETVQNILWFRASNPIFSAVWDNQHITSIEIQAKEKIGIEGRKVFYDKVGALRDLIQSHLLQLLAVTTMSLPAELTSESIHLHKQSLLESVVPADPSQAVRGQYEGYREEAEATDSATETYARLTLNIDTSEWRDVPVTITTGKALDEKRTDITVDFTDRSNPTNEVNRLVFRIQPDEGIHVQLRVKRPGLDNELQSAALDFSYQQTFGDGSQPDAYERVLVDAVKGDRTLFATSAEVLASWRIIQPVIDAWRDNADGLQTYARGSSGPAA
ncbi:MAG TPA: glucose-6-phosphate dehydrogenase [Candidatus Saccharimonadales bacterium]|nr:glucose-6-phosphate dehydrogenase [Candidatus Saccharimonadales bacterium]